MKLALSRFATGMYVVWYPVLSKPEALALPAKLKALGVSSWLDVSLSVRRRVSGRLGMSGSGLFVINPPWVLAGILDQLLPYLRQVLAEASVSEASFTLEHS